LKTIYKKSKVNTISKQIRAYEMRREEKLRMATGEMA
jgi:hypothetical protein